MNIVLLKNYNNYFDRIIKQEKTLVDYLQAVEEYEIVENVNFYDMDGVNAEHVFNFKRNFVPNYMLVIDEMNNILSKWFILEWQKIRGRQYKAILRGDVVANHFRTVLKAPCFVEKAMANSQSPFLFNKENMTFNQIKKSEYLLKDRTNIGWLVGFYAQDDKNEGRDRIIKGKVSHIEGSEAIEDISTLPKGVNVNFGDERKETIAEESYKFIFQVHKSDTEGYQSGDLRFIAYFNGQNYLKMEKGEYIWEKTISQFMSDNATRLSNAEYFDTMKRFFKSSSSKLAKLNKNLWYRDQISLSSKEDIYKLQNKFISVGSGENKEIYKLEIGPLQTNETRTIYETNSRYRDFVNAFKEGGYFPSASYYKVNIAGNWDYAFRTEYTGYRFIVRAIPIDIAYDNIEVTISHNRNHLNDSPYDMFCIPFDLRKVRTFQIMGEEGKYMSDNNLALATARTIIEQLGGSGASKFVYDVQYLPYCPIKELRDSYEPYTNAFYLIKQTGWKKGIDFDFIYKVDDLEPSVKKEIISFIAWGNESSGTFDIPFEYKVPENALDKKIKSETVLMRLCSPNYNGIFEFNPFKNDGLQYFNVDYTCKPFQSYIHINPNFGGLYGKDFNDNRGLILGGDFSIPGISDNFINYELNNKNYQEIFNREIKNMDINYDIQLEQNKFNLGFKAIGGAVAGGIGGLMTGGPVGAIGGALAGSVGTAITGLSGMHFDQQRYNEGRDFKTDMFGYNLGNIKAQPQSLSKTSPFTFNNKIYPFVEIYDCTEEERNALYNKIKYNGMTIMAIGKMEDYITDELNYFQGKIIRFDDLDDDFHVANEIYQEIAKGVYICK